MSFLGYNHMLLKIWGGTTREWHHYEALGGTLLSQNITCVYLIYSLGKRPPKILKFSQTYVLVVRNPLLQLDWTCLTPSITLKHFIDQTRSTPENSFQIQSFNSTRPSSLHLGCLKRISKSLLFMKYGCKHKIK